MEPYYQNDLGVLYHGDCVEIMPHLPKVDLVLTDPPYGKRLHLEKNKDIINKIFE
jgi:DNA modification methylase